MNKLDGQSLNVEQAEMEKLRAVFPQCFSEGKLDIDKLLNLCGEYIDNDFEKYKFEWKGKAECFRITGKRSTGTLRPAPEESVDWDTTQNIYIEGDNLEVLKLLQTSYSRKVKMIYIDPPYNTGNDFVYEDNFADPIQRYKEVTAQTTKSNPETMGRYHTNWLNMMYPRLRLAANLLRNDGVIFISIDDNEVHNLRKLCDEVFGEENFVGAISWLKKRKGSFLTKKVISVTEYILIYGKSQGITLFGGEPDQSESQPLVKRTNSIKILNFPQKKVCTKLADGEYKSGIYGDGSSAVKLLNDIKIVDGVITSAFGLEGPFIWSQENLNSQIDAGARLVINTTNFQVRVFKIYEDNAHKGLPSFIDGVSINGTNEDGYEQLRDILGAEKIMDYPKPLKLLTLLIDSCTHFDKDSIILDFFSGSATTAHAVMQLNAEDGGNRRFIMVQLPEVTDEKSEAYKAGYKNICEIGKERIRRAGRVISDKWLVVSEKRDDSTLFPDETNHYPPTTNHSKPDTGFRTFKLDTSNLAVWDATPIADAQLQELWDRFHALTKTVKGDRSDLDIVYEVMLKMGMPLSCPVSEITVGSKKTYSVSDGVLLVCLDKGITPEDIEAMCDLAPAKIIAAEEAFADDTALSNAHYILKDRDIEMKLL